MTNMKDMWANYRTYEYLDKLKSLGANVKELSDEEWEMAKKYVMKNNKWKGASYHSRYAGPDRHQKEQTLSIIII